MKNEHSFEKMNANFANRSVFLEMSYISGTFSEKLCGSDGQGPSNKPEPLHNDFWNNLYL